MVSNFKKNNPMGLSIFYSEDKGEQMVYMEANKIIKSLSDKNEIATIKQSLEYVELTKFLDEMIIKNNEDI